MNVSLLTKLLAAKEQNGKTLFFPEISENDFGKSGGDAFASTGLTFGINPQKNIFSAIVKRMRHRFDHPVVSQLVREEGPSQYIRVAQRFVRKCFRSKNSNVAFASIASNSRSSSMETESGEPSTFASLPMDDTIEIIPLEVKSIASFNSQSFDRLLCAF